MNGFQESLMFDAAPIVNHTILIEKKRCTKCGEIKKLECFYKHRGMRDGRATQCRECMYRGENREAIKERSRQWRLANTEKYKEMLFNWKKDNKQKILEYRRIYSEKNRERITSEARNRYQKDPEFRKRIYKSNRKWLKNNTEKMNSYHRMRYNSEEACKRSKEYRMRDIEKTKQMRKRNYIKRHSTPSGKINHRMSSGIRQSLVFGKGGKGWQELVGYSVDQLREHLEKQFHSGMCWERFGEIHIDHKIPLSAFNFKSYSDIDFKIAWGLENLQPLWGKDNMRKHAKLDKPFQPSLAI